MFESLKHWFESSSNEHKLFDHADDEAIHIALASLLYQVIACDHKESDKEKHEFAEILRTEFDLNSAQIANLYKQVKPLNGDINKDLETIDHYLKQNPHLRMMFMQKLNHLISLDGVTSKEMDVFYEAQKVLFPELAEKSEF
ncbi:TerB family tellurite resistance protein [Alkalimarinus sediminis]|uniref:TerB family tellurite resistance protein n=1 Tax=Alkalimarinus sediminis TaxID=1632866 RepID=A0A9E8KND8_9ALTE|nr:TerB family tellurite resistance protein [Alkalimarinus sediminis]UZW73594.1 TerB family tellurite resistance protein [Alkalimarinus sediminis]